MPRKQYNTMDAQEQFTCVIVGKSGNGKSSLCNAILEKDAFCTGSSMASVTTQMQHDCVTVGGKTIRVVDTPDVSNCEMTEEQKEKEVNKWRELAANSRTLVLIAVRCDVRYTSEEYAIYQEIAKLWGDKLLHKRLVVAFTFSDRQDKDLLQELKTTAPPELKKVFNKAKKRFLVFNKMDSRNVQEDILKHFATTRSTGSSFCCCKQ